jgi:hypothetical protein
VRGGGLENHETERIASVFAGPLVTMGHDWVRIVRRTDAIPADWRADARASQLLLFSSSAARVDERPYAVIDTVKCAAGLQPVIPGHDSKDTVVN